MSCSGDMNNSLMALLDILVIEFGFCGFGYIEWVESWGITEVFAGQVDAFIGFHRENSSRRHDPKN